MEEYLIIGVITNTHGVKGEIKVVPQTNDINRFDLLNDVFIGSEEEDNVISEYTVQAVRYQQKFVLLKLKGINNMNEALELKGKFIKVRKKDAIKLDSDEFFICDLIGCKVFENGQFLGTVIDVIQTGSNDVYVVKNESSHLKIKNNMDILIPALKDVIKRVCINEKVIEVVLPEGLIDNEI